MSTLCPNPECRAFLVEGALRCRACGADARSAEPSQAVGATFSMGSIAAEAFRAAELLDELQALAPGTLEEFRRLDRPRKERLVAILAELLEVIRRR